MTFLLLVKVKKKESNLIVYSCTQTYPKNMFLATNRHHDSGSQGTLSC